MAHRTVLLLGDSILDNAPYTAPAPDTAAHLRALLGDEWQVELLAVDGATLEDMPAQLRRIGGRSATAFLSIGGNDLTQHLGLLTRTATDSASVLSELLHVAEVFAARYDEAVRALAARVERTILCTIYEVQLQPPFDRIVRAPLAVFNDRIIRTAARLGLEVLELRDVCTSPADFVLQIEPSAQGARKIAAAAAAVLRGDTTVQTGRIHSAGT